MKIRSTTALLPLALAQPSWENEPCPDRERSAQSGTQTLLMTPTHLISISDPPWSTYCVPGKIGSTQEGKLSPVSAGTH